jgi:hypothetical protein
MRFLLLLRESLRSYIVDTFHLELIIIGIHCLGQSVSEEEDSSAC